MKREIITIDEYGRLNIPTNTVSVWMTEAEIVELFGTTAGAVNSTIKAIIKSDVLKYVVRPEISDESKMQNIGMTIQ